MTWTQVYVLWGNWWLTTLLAALPIIVLFTLLAGLRVKPHWCAIAGAATAIAVAVLFFKMPVALAGMSFLYGVAFGILKIAWIVLAAVYLYDISVHTGQFEIMKESVAGITADRRFHDRPRLQAVSRRSAEPDRQHGAGGLGRHRHSHSHARGSHRAARVRPQCHDRPDPAVYRRHRIVLAGARHGRLERHLRSAARDLGGWLLLRPHAVLLGQLRGQQPGGHHGRRGLAPGHRDLPAFLEAQTHLALRG